ncbi:hypothetical protein [Catenovulum sediminis]|uniref:hypothetical protein n=1 Tax=Catenovulum sediminis TaxID=1740262 RepID=UPI00117FFE89|nr:hypothetical protein [Catenovulum sediminis]
MNTTKLKNSVNRLTFLIAAGLLSTSSFYSTANDSTYQSLLENLKENYIASLATHNQLDAFAEKYTACQHQTQLHNKQSRNLQRQLQQQENILNSAAPAADKQFAELEQMSLQDERNKLEEDRALCDQLVNNYKTIDQKLSAEAELYQDKANKARQKLLNYLLDKKSLQASTETRSIEYPCPTRNKLACKNEAKAALLKEISEQRSMQLTSGTVIKNYMVESDTVAMQSQAEFDTVKINKESYQKTSEGLAYQMEITATFKSEYEGAEKSVDKIRIETALNRYLKDLAKKFNGKS